MSGNNNRAGAAIAFRAAFFCAGQAASPKKIQQGKVGRDIAVASFDNLSPIADLLQPGLSTMELPYYEMGRLAMNMAIDGARGGKVTRLKGRFVGRSSL